MTQSCGDVLEGTLLQTCKCLILQMQWPGKQGCRMHTHCCTRTLGSYRTQRTESQTPVHSMAQSLIWSGRTFWQARVGNNKPCWHRVVTNTKKIRIYFLAWVEISWRDLFRGKVWHPITVKGNKLVLVRSLWSKCSPGVGHLNQIWEWLKKKDLRH